MKFIFVFIDAGLCSDSGACNCSGKDWDISSLLGSLNLVDYIHAQSKEFHAMVASWEIAENLKKLIPTRCQEEGDE